LSEFRGTKGVSRFKWKIPADLKKSHKYLKSWEHPENHPKNAKPEGSSEKSDKSGKEEEKEEKEKVIFFST
jgi:hypothetical protein